MVHQRVAATFRKGRIILAGDAAHLNSPIGAMGMNSGIHDAVNLAANLLRVLDGEEDEGALDRYVRQRRHVAVEHVQTATIANKKNMEQRDPQHAAEISRGDEARRRGSRSGEEVPDAHLAHRVPARCRAGLRSHAANGSASKRRPDDSDIRGMLGPHLAELTRATASRHPGYGSSIGGIACFVVPTPV